MFVDRFIDVHKPKRAVDHPLLPIDVFFVSPIFATIVQRVDTGFKSYSVCMLVILKYLNRAVCSLIVREGVR